MSSILDGVSVVLPAHNEEENVAEAVHEALAAAELEPAIKNFKKERVERLLELSKLGENLLSALVAGQTVDPAQIEQASK